MTKRVVRKVTVKGTGRLKLDKRALTKLIRHYYKGKRNVNIHFTKKVGACWGDHNYISRSKTHHIRINPQWCQFNLTASKRNFDLLITEGLLARMSHYDTKCRVIHTLLHELRHAWQCDKNPIRYARSPGDDCRAQCWNSNIKYELSALETDAEGWSYSNFHKALERYESWCDG